MTSFPALLRRVLEDVRQDTTFSPNNNNNGTATNGTSSKAAANGTSAEENGTPTATNGNKTNGAAGAGAGAGARPSLAVPATVVDEALKVTRDCLDTVCEMDESGGT